MSLTMIPIKDTTQTVSVTDSSAATSNAFGDSTTHVRVVCTVDCFIVFGATPTATSSKTYLPADTVEFFKVPDGGTTKLAALREGSTSGTLYVTEYGG